MEKKTIKLDPIIIRDLWSDKEGEVLKALKKLRVGGNIGYIPELLKLLNKVSNENVSAEIIRFIADIKNPAVIPFIVAGLKNPDLSSVHSGIVSTCWQSGLDYSNELETFARLFLEGDYTTSLECLTVIEEVSFDLEPVEIDKLRTQIMNGIDKVSEDKKPLALELVKILKT